MRVIVIYKSRTGFTKQYAQWIAEELDCEMATFEAMRTMDFHHDDIVIYGGRVHAGKIDHLDTMIRSSETAKHKLVVFATGATPMEAKDEIEAVMRSNFGDRAIPHFYMPSGLCYEKMGWADRLIMKAMSKMLSGKGNQTETERGMANAINKSYDISDKKNIQPLIGCVRNLQQSTASGHE